MKPPRNFDNPSDPVAIAMPHVSDGVGSALRRAYPAPGAAPEEMRRLLGKIDERAGVGINRAVDG